MSAAVAAPVAVSTNLPQQNLNQVNTTNPAQNAAVIGVTGGVNAARVGAPLPGAGIAAAAANLGGVVSTPYASASLYVGDLAPHVTEAVLFEVFNAVGPCASVRVCRDSATRRSLGYAYVNFHRAEDAERALDTLNFKPISGRACRIMWCHRDPSLRKSGLGNIFINHLDKTIDHKSLFDTFSRFGNILSCKVSTNAKGESLGYGFVHFENEESAQAAIDKVNGMKLLNSIVQVQSFKSKKERHGAAQSKGKFTNVFVKNLPSSATREVIEQNFKSAGNITSSIVVPDKNDKTRAYGFVNFATPEEATKAVETLNGLEIDGKKIFVGRAQKKEEREKELREKFEAAKMERAKKFQGTNLYIKNLPDDITDEKLRQAFTPFGSISSARVMKDPNGRSKNFGFVCFSAAEEATKAVTEMNGKMFEGKPLYVAIAQRKEQRRAMLENQFSRGPKNQANGLGAGPIPGPQFAGPNAMGFIPGQQAPFPMFPNQIPGVNLQRQFMGYPQQLPFKMPPWSGPAAGPQGPHMLGMTGIPGVGIPGALRPNQVPLNYPMNLGPANMPGPNGQHNQGPRTNMNQQRGGRQHGHQQHHHQNQNQQNQRQQQQNQANGPVPNIRYNDNARNLPNNRNPNQGAPGQQPGGQQSANGNDAAANQAITLGGNEPLSLKSLLAVPEEQQKQMVGERLFPLVQNQQPTLAGKITGMLLEMNVGELLHLLESSSALNEKINEAIAVLQQAENEPETADK